MERMAKLLDTWKRDVKGQVYTRESGVNEKVSKCYNTASSWVSG